MAAIIRNLVLCFVLTLTGHLVICDENNSGNSFCCAIDLEEIEIDVVRLKPVKKSEWEEKEVIVGYKDCGIVGQSTCPIYDYVWDEVVFYRMEDVVEKDTYTVPCPNKQLVCCEGYEMFHDNCYRPNEIEELKKLEALGIIG